MTDTHVTEQARRIFDFTLEANDYLKEPVRNIFGAERVLSEIRQIALTLGSPGSGQAIVPISADDWESARPSELAPIDESWVPEDPWDTDDYGEEDAEADELHAQALEDAKVVRDFERQLKAIHI